MNEITTRATAALAFLREKFPANGPQPSYFRVATRSSHRDFATLEEAKSFANRQGFETGLMVAPAKMTLRLFHGQKWHPGGFDATTYIVVAEHHGFEI
jgi:hypothetical protein